MKKTIFLLVGAVTMLFALNSCNPKADPDTTLTFSTLSVEQQKAAIEKDGLDLADKITGLQQTQGFVSLSLFAGTSGMFNAPALVSPFRQLSASLLQNDAKSLENFNNQMRVASNAGADVWGTWNWNKSTQQFDKASTVILNTAVFNFPADNLNSTVNNAVLTIIYKESNVLIPEVDPAELFPKSLSVILKVGNTEALNAQFNGTYQTDGTPTSLISTLVIGAYNWSATVADAGKDVSANFTFKYNAQILLKYEAGAAGSFTATQIEAAMNNSDSKPEDIFTSGFMSFQLMNVAVYGGITDVKGFMAEENALRPDSIVHNDQYYKWTEYIYTKSYYDSEVLIFNKYLKFYGYFATENKKFADVEFFVAEGQEPDYNRSTATLVYTQTSTNYNPNPPSTLKYDYYDYSYNYNNYEYTFKYYAYKTKTVYNAQPRLVLSDGSKITDFNKYANDNFGTVIAKFESMLPQ